MKKDDILNDDMASVSVTLEDGSEILCSVITIFTAGGKDYIALLPLDGPDAESGEVYLYGYREPLSDDGEPELLNITDDEEYEIACDGFDEYLDAAEFDELIEEEE